MPRLPLVDFRLRQDFVFPEVLESGIDGIPVFQLGRLPPWVTSESGWQNRLPPCCEKAVELEHGKDSSY